MVVGTAHAQDANAEQIAGDTSDKSGTNPVNFQRDLRFYNEYSWLNTAGDGNQNALTMEYRQPLFDGEFVLREFRWLKDTHLRMSLETDEQKIVEAIAFNSEYTEPSADTRVRVAYRLSVNDYFGDGRLQLIVEHCEPLP